MTKRRLDDWVSASVAAHRLGVSARTLRPDTQEGRLPDARGAGGRRILRIGDLEAIGDIPSHGIAVAYARVSSRRQQAEADRDRQVARLGGHGGEDLAVFTDVASACRTGGSGYAVRWAGA